MILALKTQDLLHFFSLKRINTLLQQAHIRLIKSESKKLKDML